MANHKRKKTKRCVRCTLCTTHRWSGNSKDRFKAKCPVKGRDNALETEG